MRIFLIAVFALLSACGSGNNIVGKWTTISQNGSAEIKQTCDFNSNGTETCDVEYRLIVDGQQYAIDYVATYEWSIKGNFLVFKNVDAVVSSVEADSEGLSRSDERFLNLQGVVMAQHIKGKTGQREYKIKNGNLLLKLKGEEWETWTRS